MSTILRKSVYILLFLLFTSCSSPILEPTQTKLFITPEPTTIIETQPQNTTPNDPVIKILFIGNSYTAYHNLPEMFEKLMISGGYDVNVEQSVNGGRSLSYHAISSETIEKIANTDWDYVVLQEQSVVTNPDIGFFPAVRDLHARITQTGAETILFMTWGRRDGLPSAGFADYESMQAQVQENYLEIANELDLLVAPVGAVWQNALAENPEFNLWDRDGSHPSLEGSYLAANVFYGLITGESPIGLDYTAKLDEETATFLQSITTNSIQANRQLLTFYDLFNGFDYESPLNETALTIPTNPVPPTHVFEGRLKFVDEANHGNIRVYKGAASEEESIYLPVFDFEFVQQGNYLIPVRRGLIIADHPDLNYIIEPGRVWQEESDQGYSRASFPFAIVWKGSNAIMNGTMSFLFDDKEVSQIWYQITQETTISFSADLWGLLEGSYHPGPVSDSAKIKAAFTQELDDRFPTKPIETLVEDYPGVDLSAFGQGVIPKNMTWYGFVIDGVNYVGGCQTRYGTYPYCEHMRAPSYSTAKSAFASLALMRLAQKYDPDLPNFLIKDYVIETADSIGDWSAVTFDHTLDMATGNFETSTRMVDEEHWDTDPFWSEEYYDEKIAAAFNWPHNTDPGTTWVYRTFDTFIVTRAMHNYLQSQVGENADIFEFMVDEVYTPLKMSPGVFSTLRTKDNSWQGQAYGGYGLWWIPDDLAKISTFLSVDHGTIEGEQILHPDLLNDALQLDPTDRGVMRDRNGRYNNAFWADEYNIEGCRFWVPHMYGYSGIVVSLMPNGTTYYYASDGQEFTSKAAIQESHKMRSMCKDSSATLDPSTSNGITHQMEVYVPKGANAPIIDGTITPGEWEGATIETFVDGSELMLLHNEGYLYLAIQDATTEMIVGNVFVNHGDEISILHTSAALGTAIYQEATDSWQQGKVFEWCCRGTSDNPRAQTERDVFFQQEGWVSINSRVGTPNELEYQIKIGDAPIRLAVNYLSVSSNPDDTKKTWPANLADDVSRPTPGGLPAEMSFSPEQWRVLKFND